jgi:hypothetical protein
MEHKSTLERAIDACNAWQANPNEELLQELEDLVDILALNYKERREPPRAIHILGQNSVTTAWLFARFLRGGQDR